MSRNGQWLDDSEITCKLNGWGGFSLLSVHKVYEFCLHGLGVSLSKVFSMSSARTLSLLYGSGLNLLITLEKFCFLYQWIKCFIGESSVSNFLTHEINTTDCSTVERYPKGTGCCLSAEAQRSVQANSPTAGSAMLLISTGTGISTLPFILDCRIPLDTLCCYFMEITLEIPIKIPAKKKLSVTIPIAPVFKINSALSVSLSPLSQSLKQENVLVKNSCSNFLVLQSNSGLF